MDNNEIKKANRKAMPKFLLLVALGAIVGWLIGFFASKFGLSALTEKFKALGEFFGLQIAPWIMPAIAVALPAAAVPIYIKARRLLGSWDGEDEEVSDAVEKKLSIVIWIADAAVILSFFFITASYSGAFAAFDRDEVNLLPYFAAIIGFIAILVEAVIIEQKCVDTTKEMNPEKTASVYDTKFHKKWFNSCDEAERLLIGKCAFKAYSATKRVCALLTIVLSMCALIFGIGFLPSFSVCVIWMVNQFAYFKEAIKYSKSGSSMM